MGPPAKRRKIASAKVEEIPFDFDARAEYLTGFHKRKLQRIKHGQEEAAKKERIERLEQRKKLREGRREKVQKHVETVNALLREASGNGRVESDADDGSNATGDEWSGIDDRPAKVPVDHEDEYVDEDRFTTVTVESIGVSKDGLYKVSGDDDDTNQDGAGDGQDGNGRGIKPNPPENKQIGKRTWTKDKPATLKKRKKKFRYESKVERKLSRAKERAGSKAKARARRE